MLKQTSSGSVCTNADVHLREASTHTGRFIVSNYKLTLINAAIVAQTRGSVCAIAH